MKVELMKLAATMTFAAASINVSAAECSQGSSNYSYLPDPEITAQMVRPRESKSGAVAINIRDAHGHSNHWFVVDQGSSYYARLVLTENSDAKHWRDPNPDGMRKIPDMEIYGFDRNFKYVGGMTREGVSPPRYLFVPDLAEYMTHAQEDTRRVEPGMFQLVSCN